MRQSLRCASGLSWQRSITTRRNRKRQRLGAKQRRLACERLEERCLLNGLSFAPAATYATGGAYATSVAIGDFNKDGKADLAVDNTNSHTVGILLGNADGTFAAGVPYASGAQYPHGPAVGDLNSDGNADLALTHHITNTVGVLLGKGDGTFATSVLYPSGGSQTEGVVIGDLNGDHKNDLIVSNGYSNTVGVLLNNGDGTFAPAVQYGSGGQRPLGLAAVDLNGDHKIDLAVANETNPGTVGILLGNGDGTFAAGVAYSSGDNSAAAVAAADFNGDGKPDLAVSHAAFPATVGVLLNNGDGTFAPPVSYDGGGSATYSVQVGDFNGDGRTDLVVANAASGNLGVLLGYGDGTFAAAVTFASGGGQPRTVAAGDFNGDGKPDLAVANETSNNVGVLLNTSTAVPTDINMISATAPDPHHVTLNYQISGTAVGSFQVGIYRSNHPDFSGVEQIGSLLTVTDANPGVHSQTIYLPVALNPRPYLFVKADPNGAVSETDKSNNVAFLVPTMPQLLYRERDTGIPGIDHVGLYPGGNEKVWEAQVDQQGIWWDPYSRTLIQVDPWDTGLEVQAVHSLGSFWYDGAFYLDASGRMVLEESPVKIAESASVPIQSSVAQEMVDYSTAAKGSDFLAWYNWFLSVPIRTLPSLPKPFETFNNLAKGATGQFTCVGLTEKASEYAGVSGGMGFVPDYVEWVLPLTPSLQYFFAKANKASQPATGAITGWFDPVDFILTDPAGRRLGHANGETYFEIPDAFYSGDGDFEMFVIPERIKGGYNLELFGLGQEYAGDVRSFYTNESYDQWSFSGFLDVGQTSVAALNDPPHITSLSTSSPITEGETAILSAEFADAYTMDGHVTVVDWGDGSLPTTITLPAGATTIPATSHLYVDNRAGNAPYTINVTVTDEDGASGSGSTPVIVNNIAPTVRPITGNTIAVRGQPLSYSALFDDPGTLDTHTATFDWGDGSSSSSAVQESNGSGSASGGHTYTESGTYTILLAVTDDDGGVGTRAMTVNVVPVAVEADPLYPGQNALFVGGTTGDDDIEVEGKCRSNRVEVSIESERPRGEYEQTFLGPFSRIVVYGQAGNDNIQAEEDVPIPAWLFGGEGNDRLQAGSGPSVLVGGDGNDRLEGGKGRSLLIGGRGSDRLEAGKGDAILIGGYTDYDTDEAALAAILKEWTQPDNVARYHQRVNHIFGAVAGGANGNYFLNKATVHDDLARDQLEGNSGLDWYFASLSALDSHKRDKVSGAKPAEVLTDISGW